MVVLLSMEGWRLAVTETRTEARPTSPSPAASTHHNLQIDSKAQPSRRHHLKDGQGSSRNTVSLRLNPADVRAADGQGWNGS